MKQQAELNPAAAARSREIDTGPGTEAITTLSDAEMDRRRSALQDIYQSAKSVEPASLLSELTSRAEYASTLPPYEEVVGLHHARELLATALIARLQSTAPASEREALVRDLVTAVTHQRALVHSATTVFGSDLRVAGHRVDAALAALAACPPPTAGEGQEAAQ